MKTIVSAIQSKDFITAGKELAKDQNGKGVKQSALFSSIGRELFTVGATLAQLNQFADTVRELVDNKQDLSRNLKTYVLRGFNDQAVRSGKTDKVLHFWSPKSGTPAQFTYDAEPAKAPKTVTASGKSDAPTGDSAPDSSNSTPEKQAEILEKITLSIADVESAYRKGAFTLADLVGLIDRLTADELAKQIAKAA